jgi:hypothetical protein
VSYDYYKLILTGAVILYKDATRPNLIPISERLP